MSTDEARKKIASLTGLIARWCDLTGNAPDATKGQTPEAMLEEFLNRTAQAKRTEKPSSTRWKF